MPDTSRSRSEEHTSDLQSQFHIVCRLLLEKKKNDSEANTVQETITFDNGIVDAMSIIMGNIPSTLESSGNSAKVNSANINAGGSATTNATLIVVSPNGP